MHAKAGNRLLGSGQLQMDDWLEPLIPASKSVEEDPVNVRGTEVGRTSYGKSFTAV